MFIQPAGQLFCVAKIQTLAITYKLFNQSFFMLALLKDIIDFYAFIDRLCGLVVKASSSRAEDPGIFQG